MTNPPSDLPSDQAFEKLPPVYLADYEEDAENPVVIVVEVTEVIAKPKGFVMEGYLGELLADLTSAAGFNMKIGKTKESVMETPGVE